MEPIQPEVYEEEDGPVSASGKRPAPGRGYVTKEGKIKPFTHRRSQSVIEMTDVIPLSSPVPAKDAAVAHAAEDQAAVIRKHAEEVTSRITKRNNRIAAASGRRVVRPPVGEICKQVQVMSGTARSGKGRSLLKRALGEQLKKTKLVAMCLNREIKSLRGRRGFIARVNITKTPAALERLATAEKKRAALYAEKIRLRRLDFEAGIVGLPRRQPERPGPRYVGKEAKAARAKEVRQAQLAAQRESVVNQLGLGAFQ